MRVTLVNILDKNCSLIGIDIDPLAVDSSKKRFRENSNVSIFLKDVFNTGFENNFFDYAICMLVFVNFGKNKLKFLEEVKRIIKKEGEIILSAYNEDAFEERIKIYRKIGAPIKKVVGTTVFLKDFLR